MSDVQQEDGWGIDESDGEMEYIYIYIIMMIAYDDIEKENMCAR